MEFDIPDVEFSNFLSAMVVIIIFCQLHEIQSNFVAKEELAVWSKVTQKFVWDENVGDVFKVKSPPCQLHGTLIYLRHLSTQSYLFSWNCLVRAYAIHT